MLALSYWEKQTYFDSVDVLIVGGGIVGLSTALNIKLSAPQLKVLVVERGFLPHGASTKNAGFACFGSVSELLDDLKSMSETDVLNLVEKRFRGLALLRKTLGDSSIDFEGKGGFELFTTDQQQLFQECVEAIPALNSKLAAIISKQSIFRVQDDQIKSFGFSGVDHIICNNFEGQINTGKMMEALLTKVRNLGVFVINGLEIKEILEGDLAADVYTTEGFSFRAQSVCICTNGFARKLLPDLLVLPARSQVLVTERISNLKISGTFHYDRGYTYFRDLDQRILLGGARNLAIDQEATDSFGLSEKIQDHLESLLRTVILPKANIQIEQRWSGIMGLGDKKTTIVRKHSEHVYCAVRMGGMGVAIGSLIGQETAQMLIADL